MLVLDAVAGAACSRSGAAGAAGRRRSVSTWRPIPGRSIRSSAIPTRPRSSSRSLAWLRAVRGSRRRGDARCRRSCRRSRRGPTAASRPTAVRSSTGCAGRALERRPAGDLGRRALHAARDPRSPQPGPLARGLRSHRSRVRARRAHRRLPSEARLGAGRDDVLFVRASRRSSCLPAHVLRAQEPLAAGAFNAAPTVGDGPYRFVSWQRGDALRYEPNPALLARQAGGRRALSCASFPIRPRTCSCCRSGAAGLESRRAGAVCRRCAPRSGTRVRRASRRPSSRGLRSIRRARRSTTSRVRRALAMSIDRDAISRKITLGRLSRHQHDAAAVSRGHSIRPCASPDTIRAAADRLFDARRLAARPRRLAAQRRHAAASDVRAVSGNGDGRTRRHGRAGRAARARRRRHDQGREQRAALPSAHGRARRPADSTSRTFPGRWAPIPTIRPFSPAAHASNYMRWCDPRVDALGARRLGASTARASASAPTRSIGEIVAEQVPVLYLFNADYVYAYRRRLHGFAPNAFLPTWNAYGWRLAR